MWNPSISTKNQFIFVRCIYVWPIDNLVPCQIYCIYFNEILQIYISHCIHYNYFNIKIMESVVVLGHSFPNFLLMIKCICLPIPQFTIYTTLKLKPPCSFSVTSQSFSPLNLPPFEEVISLFKCWTPFYLGTIPTSSWCPCPAKVTWWPHWCSVKCLVFGRASSHRNHVNTDKRSLLQPSNSAVPLKASYPCRWMILNSLTHQLISFFSHIHVCTYLSPLLCNFLLLLSWFFLSLYVRYSFTPYLPPNSYPLTLCFFFFYYRLYIYQMGKFIYKIILLINWKSTFYLKKPFTMLPMNHIVYCVLNKFSIPTSVSMKFPTSFTYLMSLIKSEV